METKYTENKIIEISIDDRIVGEIKLNENRKIKNLNLYGDHFSDKTKFEHILEVLNRINKDYEWVKD